MRVNRVRKCQVDQGLCSKCGSPIEVGDPYVWWKYRTAEGGVRVIRCDSPDCYPDGKDLTLSEWVKSMHECQREIQDALDADQIRRVLKRLLDIHDEQTDRLNNIPANLRDGPVGVKMSERIHECRENHDAVEAAVEVFEDEFGEGNPMTHEAWKAEETAHYHSIRKKRLDSVKKHFNIV